MGSAQGRNCRVENKIDITLVEGRAEIEAQTVGDGSVVRHAPHGVMAVIGPFNFPLSLSHGHIVPALLAGNTVVLKPSEQTPLCAEVYAALFDHFPPGVFNLVQGDGEIGKALSTHAGVSGVLFTGSYAVGRALQLACIDQPNKILALEMGGKNASVVREDADHQLALYEVCFCCIRHHRPALHGDVSFDSLRLDRFRRAVRAKSCVSPPLWSTVIR